MIVSSWDAVLILWRGAALARGPDPLGEGDGDDGAGDVGDEGEGEGRAAVRMVLMPLEARNRDRGEPGSAPAHVRADPYGCVLTRAARPRAGRECRAGS
ncbi:hypothetical protein GCM10009733_038340 [Nonomuraea maheshkhaliensis]|uniref:Uncharacterized protein n=1 Tax=Nonomuraea maheshkhaliensis TaxID=419590 RepID=A0ABN2FA81_9ACTN